MKGVGCSSGLPPFILNLVTRWNFKLHTPYHEGKAYLSTEYESEWILEQDLTS